MLIFAKAADCLTAVLVAVLCVQALRAQTQPIQYYYDDLGQLIKVIDSSNSEIDNTCVWSAGACPALHPAACCRERGIFNSPQQAAAHKAKASFRTPKHFAL